MVETGTTSVGGSDKALAISPAIGIVLEPKIQLTQGIDDLVARARHRNVRFIGIVSRTESGLSPPLHSALLSVGVPIHIFPLRLYTTLRAALHDRRRTNIVVLGQGRDPWLDLAIYLDHALTVGAH